MNTIMYIISACLVGIKCRYDGKGKPNENILKLIKNEKYIIVCPEQLGGLPTPRIPAENKDGKIITKDNKNVTQNYIKGAKEALNIAKLYGCKKAILKNKSPMCGCGKIYDGNFNGTLIKGDGVFCKLLKKEGFELFSDEDII